VTVFPSGEQIAISHDDLHATVVQVGGGLRTLSAGDLSVLDGFGEEEMCHDGRGQLLLPWPNRLAGGKYSFEGQSYQLPLTEPPHGNAIHGLVRWATWSVEERSAGSVTMFHRLYPSPGYPFTLDLSATYTLSAEGLLVTLHAVNRGVESCPFGAGQHPYLRIGTPTIDTVSLRVPARSIYRYDDRYIPIECLPVADTPLDFRTQHPIGDTVINMDYTDLERDPDGRARVVLQAPDDGPTAEVWLDQTFKHVTVFTGETVQPPSRRRQGIAIEAMTCPPNAFVSGEDLLVLQPGERWQGSWGITIRR
jgi:aldose 1-epimerase